MDPNANLAAQLRLARKDWTGFETEELTSDQIQDLHHAHISLCELVLGLHGWLNNFGFLPDEWEG